MSDQDFRYTMPDGSQVEAFQMTEATRYQEGLWPEWMDSKMLLTSEGNDGRKKHYLTVGETETEIPEYGWIVNRDGNISAVGYEVMEAATKVTRIVPKVPEVAKPQSEAALRLAAKITKRPYDEIVAEDHAEVEQANRNRQAIIDSMHPEDAAAQGLKQSQTMSEVYEEVADSMQREDVLISHEMAEVTSADDPGHFETLKIALELLQEDKRDECESLLCGYIAQHIDWCSCPPGHCDGRRNRWECRQNSPLVT